MGLVRSDSEHVVGDVSKNVEVSIVKETNQSIQ